MKRIKAINGYTIYAASERDAQRYNVEPGYFYLYFSSDIRDYGLACADWEWQAGSFEEAAAWAASSNYAIAKEIVEERTTAASFEEIAAVEAQLDAGLTADEIETAAEADDDELPALHNVYTGETFAAPARALYNALRYTIRSRVHDTEYRGTNRGAVRLARWAMLDDWRPVHAFGPLGALEARIIDAVRDWVPGWFPPEYQLKTRLFESRRDALCENVPPHKCDCARCPARDLCAWLDWWEKVR